MRQSSPISFKILITGLALAAVMLSGCSRDLHKVVQNDKSQPPAVQPTNTSEVIQPAASSAVDSVYDSLDQDLQSLSDQLKTPELPQTIHRTDS